MSHGIGFYVDLLEVELMLWMGVNPWKWGKDFGERSLA
jgi:hypothetical protein